MLHWKHLFSKAFRHLNVLATWCINSEKIIGENGFPYHFKKIIARYKKVDYNTDVLRQIACLVVNPIKVNNFAYLFDCMPYTEWRHHPKLIDDW